MSRKAVIFCCILEGDSSEIFGISSIRLIGVYQMGDDSHLYRDATEKVLILRKTVQDKVYLYVFHYYILYVKTVFQWRPIGGEKQASISGGSQSPI